MARKLPGLLTRARYRSRSSVTRFAPGNVLDSDRSTYWCAEDTATAAGLVLDLAGETTFNVVSLREYLPLSQCVETWTLDRWDGTAWTEFGAGRAIGSRRF